MPIDEEVRKPRSTPLAPATVEAKQAGEGIHRIAGTGPARSALMSLATALTASTAAFARRSRTQTERRQHGWHSQSMTS